VTGLDAQPPLVGRTTLTPQDGALLLKAGRARVGLFNQQLWLRFSTLAALLAAIFCVEGYARFPLVLLVLALVLYALAIYAGLRTGRTISSSYGRGQEREISIADDGVTIHEPGMTITQAWTRYDRALENADYFVLLTGPGIVALPKRAFTPQDVALVRERIAAKLPIRPLR
jgi:YcxB-like protein